MARSRIRLQANPPLGRHRFLRPTLRILLKRNLTDEEQADGSEQPPVRAARAGRNGGFVGDCATPRQGHAYIHGYCAVVFIKHIQ